MPKFNYIYIFMIKVYKWHITPLIRCACLHVCSVMSYSLQPHGLQPARILCSWYFSRLEYWSGLPFPPPGDVPSPRIKPMSPVSSALKGRSFISEPLGKPIRCQIHTSLSSPGCSEWGKMYFAELGEWWVWYNHVDGILAITMSISVLNIYAKWTNNSTSRIHTYKISKRFHCRVIHHRKRWKKPEDYWIPRFQCFFFFFFFFYEEVKQYNESRMS